MFVAPVQAALEGRRGASATATAKEDIASTAIARGIRAETADRVPVVVHEEAEPERGTHPLRGAYQVAYRVAWGIRRAVKPLTTQAFRHRVRHALMRKAYFDDSYETPPLVTAAGGLAAAGGGGHGHRNIRRTCPRIFPRSRRATAASTSSGISPRKAASANPHGRCCAS